MSQAREHAAAKWMDRLSDAVGSLVPGCARLPTRHPVKVSLMMTLLACLAAWLSIAIIEVDDLLLGGLWGSDSFVYVLPGAFLGWMVLLPLNQWLQRGVVRPILVIVLSITANVIHVAVANDHVNELSWSLLWAGTVAGLAYSTAGMIAISGRRWWLFLPVTAVCILAHGMITFADSLPSGLWLIPDEIFAFSLLANFFATIFIGIGVAFGSVLWDRTPRPELDPQTGEIP